MIKIENTHVDNIVRAVYSSRNAMNSWDKSDSDWKNDILGDNDLTLAKSLVKAGTDHSKFMRMITVTCDITAPLYWWKEFDTYKVGTVRNSCSTMHKITEKEFTLDDFSHDRLLVVEKLETIIDWLNEYRNIYVNWDKHRSYVDSNGVELNKNDIWWQIIQLLPSSYNQKATVQLNYAVLRNMYHSRKNHKLNEWSGKDNPDVPNFCSWVKSLPYAKELILINE